MHYFYPVSSVRQQRARKQKESSKRRDSILCPGDDSFSRENRSLGVLVSAQLAQLVLFGTAGHPGWGCGGSISDSQALVNCEWDLFCLLLALESKKVLFHLGSLCLYTLNIFGCWTAFKSKLGDAERPG